MTSNVKAWRLPFKTVEAVTDINPSTGEEHTIPWRYDVNVRILLREGTPNGMPPDEVLECDDLERKIAAADGECLLDSKERGILLRRLNAWRFGRGGPHIAQFIRDIRDMEEVSLEKVEGGE